MKSVNICPRIYNITRITSYIEREKERKKERKKGRHLVTKGNLPSCVAKVKSTPLLIGYAI